MIDPPDSKHIAIYIPSLAGGGAERVMVMLANSLAARGHRVDLVLVKAKGPYLPDVCDEVRIVDLNKGRAMASLIPLVRYLRRERPESMLSALNYANMIAIIARKISNINIRLVISERNSISRTGKDSHGPIFLLAMKNLYKHSDCIVGISQGVSDDLHEKLGISLKKIHTIHNPVEIDKIYNLMDDDIPHSIYLKKDVPIILSAGRLNKQKDFPTLLRSFSKVLSKRNVYLIILGQGEEEKYLKSMSEDLNISENVIFAGFQRNPFSWMRRCDVYVMSSAWEGFGNVLTEAMTCGAKIVSTDCQSGPSEILEGGKWGRLVPVGDDAKLADAIIAALDDPSPPDVQRRAADFRIEYAVDEYERILCG